MTDVEIIAEGFAFCEAPRAEADGTVWFSDLTGGGYYRRKPGGAIETVLADRIWIGGAVLDEGGGVVLGGKGGLILLDADGATQPLLEEIAGRPIIAVNDIEGDGRGGLFGGTIDFEAVFVRGEKPGGGSFFHLAPDGTVTVLRDDVVASNGIGFSPDGRLLYHSESTVGIWEWRLGADGLPHSPRLLAAADDCDGLAVDAEGCLWVAFWSEAVIRRFRPDGGVDRCIALPFPHVVSLAFGGADGHDLYVATGGDADHPGKGGVARIRVDVPGLPVHRTRFARVPV
jgi:xylono-1,5-lactonase